jgi:O-antigen ligase
MKLGYHQMSNVDIIPNRLSLGRLCFFLTWAILFSYLLLGEVLIKLSIDMPYVGAFLLLLLLFFTLVMMIARLSFVYDDISMLQLLLLIYFPVVVAFNIHDSKFFFGNYLPFLTSFIVFSSIQNNPCFYRKHYISIIEKFTRGFAIILSVQIAFQSGIFSNQYNEGFILGLGGGNTIGFYLLMLFFVIYHTKKNKLDISILVLLFLSMLLTSSRGTLLSFIVVFIAMQPPARRLIFFVFLLVAVLFSFDPVVFSKLTNILPFLSSGSNDDVTSGRLIIYMSAYETILDNFFYGIGFGNFIIPDLASFNFDKIWRPHNILLEIQLSGGIIATILFLMIVLIFYLRMLPNINKDPLVKGIFFGVTAALLQGMLTPTIFSYKIDSFFWFYIGVAMVLCRKQRSIRS